FPYATPADVFREHAALSAFENDGGRIFDIGGLSTLSDNGYDAMPPVRWPVRTDGQESGRLFAEGGFATPDGKARFVPTEWRPPAARQERRYPFMLNTGRIRDQWHTMTRTGLAPRLMAHRDEPYLELHPHDAMKLGIGDGDLVRVQTVHADAVLRALVTDGQRIGEAFAPMHWTDRFASSGPVDRLVAGVCDPVSGQPELKATAARLAPVPTLWRGLLVGDMQRRDGIYHARIPTEAGQIHELRGWRPLPAPEDMGGWADGLIGRRGQRLEVIDPLTGAYRFA